MSKFYEKASAVEAITFDELVAHGLASGTPHIHNGMPWSFEYKGRPVTHENDDCYLVIFLGETVRFERGEMLVTDAKGNTRPMSAHAFERDYAPIPFLALPV